MYLWYLKTIIKLKWIIRMTKNDRDNIVKQINELDSELCEIQKIIISRKNISDANTKEFLTRLNEKIQKLRLKK